MKTIRILKVSPNAPDTNSVWLNKNTAKYFNNGAWTTIGGGSGIESAEFTSDSSSATMNLYQDGIADPIEANLPLAKPNAYGLVLQAAYTGSLATDAELATVITKVNDIISKLKVANIMDRGAN